MLICASAQSQSLFFDGFEGVTAPASLEGAATGSGIFAAPWNVQNDDLGLDGPTTGGVQSGSPVAGYNIRNTTPLTGASGNYATGGDGYQGANRILDREAAIAINSGLGDGSTTSIGGGGVTLNFSGVLRRDENQQSIVLGLGSFAFGSGVNSANTGFGFGDVDNNGFIDVFSRGQTFNSPIALVNGTSYLINVQAAFAQTGTAANLTLSVNGVFAGTLATTNATFNELGFYGQNGPNRTSVDNLSLSVVPEPSSLALGVIGVLGIVARRRRSNS
jgi:hypothetical protein